MQNAQGSKNFVEERSDFAEHQARMPDARNSLSTPTSDVSRTSWTENKNSKDVSEAAGPGLAAEESVSRPGPPQGQEGSGRRVQPVRLERPGAGLDHASHRAVVFPGWVGE